MTILVIGVAMSVWSQHEAKKNPENKEESKTVSLRATVASVGDTRFEISNQDSFDWHQVVFKLNPGLFGTYRLDYGTVRAGTAVTVRAVDFTDSDGKRFNPFEYKPQTLLVSCQTPHGKGVHGVEWK